jgi:hypothetical protein
LPWKTKVKDKKKISEGGVDITLKYKTRQGYAQAITFFSNIQELPIILFFSFLLLWVEAGGRDAPPTSPPPELLVEHTRSVQKKTSHSRLALKSLTDLYKKL